MLSDYTLSKAKTLAIIKNSYEDTYDNGHGVDTKGKRSPDGKHREYQWAREFAKRLKGALIESGLDADLITPEETDISITKRCARVNQVCKELGAKNVILISIHNNAAGSNGQWLNARGFSCHVGLNASTKSKDLATFIAQCAQESGIKVRKQNTHQWYWAQNLGICRDTQCPAVLVENLFQDNKEDIALLHDEEFLKTLCCAYINGIQMYIKKYIYYHG